MTLAEWIAKYEQKTNDRFEPKDGFKLFYLPERGFCELRIDQDQQMVLLWQVCGDGRFWRDFAEGVGQIFGYRRFGTIGIRYGAKAYMRLFGFGVTGEETLPDGNKRYYGAGGRGTCRCSPAWVQNGRLAYYITWEVH